MPQHLRIHRWTFSDAAVLIPVQVAAAHPHRPNPHGDLAVARVGRLQHFAFFKDTRGEELNGSHARRPNKPTFELIACVGYFTPMVNPDWLATPPTVTITGNAGPAVTVIGTVTLSCIKPGIDPGGACAASTVAPWPPIETDGARIGVTAGDAGMS